MRKLLIAVGLIALGWLCAIWFQQEIDIKYVHIYQDANCSNQRQITIRSYPRYVSPTINLFAPDKTE